jgi:D-lactate dehydrogenase (cytochrome)
LVFTLMPPAGPEPEIAMNAPHLVPRSRPAPDALSQVLERLSARFAERFSTSAAVREQHASTLTWAANEPPDAVVYPQTTQEVAEIVGLCARWRIPVIPFGTGSSLEGHVNAPFGGVSIDTSRMNAVRAIHPEDLDCVVEPGVTRKQLNAHLRDQGLFFPIDPGADASLGGMVATRASGTNAVRYGTMRENVVALEAVMPDGSIARTARRARKSSAGYDLTRLLVGSEGTLGIVTEITLKLHGIPEAISGGICPFPTLRAACEATILTIQSGIPVARIEFLDAPQVAACNAYSGLSLPERPTLFVEFHGTEAGVREEARRFGEIADELGGGPFSWTTDPQERTRLWQARHDAYWAALSLRPGAKGISTDVCVPLSRLADCVEETAADIAASGLVAPIVGHVGDGNFHVLPLVDVDDAQEVERARTFIDRLVERALAMEGTCTGEHGVGQKKMKFLEADTGAPALDSTRAIKRPIAPHAIMNPGTIVAQ